MALENTAIFSDFEADVRWREALTWASTDLNPSPLYKFTRCDELPNFLPLSRKKSVTSSEVIIEPPDQKQFFNSVRENHAHCGTILRALMVSLPSRKEVVTTFSISAVDYAIAAEQANALFSSAAQQRMQQIDREKGPLPPL